MKFRVTGYSNDRGAKMALEFEAESKGAAERKAMQSGMSVTRVEVVTDADGTIPDAPARTATSHKPGMLRNLIGVAVLVAIVLIFHDQIMQVFHYAMNQVHH